jgi:hypothetical protein
MSLRSQEHDEDKLQLEETNDDQRSSNSSSNIIEIIKTDQFEIKLKNNSERSNSQFCIKKKKFSATIWKMCHFHDIRLSDIIKHAIIISAKIATIYLTHNYYFSLQRRSMDPVPTIKILSIKSKNYLSDYVTKQIFQMKNDVII